MCSARLENVEYPEQLPHTWKLSATFGISPSFAFGQVDPLQRMRRLYSILHALAFYKTEDTRKRAESAISMYAQWAHVSSIVDAIEDLPIGIAAPIKEAIRTSQLSPSGS